MAKAWKQNLTSYRDQIANRNQGQIRQTLIPSYGIEISQASMSCRTRDGVVHFVLRIDWI